MLNCGQNTYQNRIWIVVKYQQQFSKNMIYSSVQLDENWNKYSDQNC